MGKSTIECRVCGSKHSYCPACSFKPNDYLDNGFCGEECYKIWVTLSRNGCKLATAKETLDELSKLKVPAKLVPSIQAHIDALKAEVKSAKELPEAKSWNKAKK